MVRLPECVVDGPNMDTCSESHLSKLTLFVKRWWEDGYGQVGSFSNIFYFGLHV